MDAVRYVAKEQGIKLPRGWKKQVRHIFQSVDTNGDKKVSKEELLSAIFQAVDSNDDGEWSLEEVYDAIEAVAEHAQATLKAGWKAEVAGAFKEVDADNSGKVSAAELKAAIKEHGYPDLSELFE
jgi:Ca2+-binding EF-hand superfamily protein